MNVFMIVTVALVSLVIFYKVVKLFKLILTQKSRLYQMNWEIGIKEHENKEFLAKIRLLESELANLKKTLKDIENVQKNNRARENLYSLMNDIIDNISDHTDSPAEIKNNVSSLKEILQEIIEHDG